MENENLSDEIPSNQNNTNNSSDPDDLSSEVFEQIAISRTIGRKIKELSSADFDMVNIKEIPGDRANSRFVYTVDEKQLYMYKDRIGYGETWRCVKYRQFKCNARIIRRPTGDTIKLKKSPAHTHASTGEQRFLNCKALNAAVKKFADLTTLANGPQSLAKVFSSVMVEHQDCTLQFKSVKRTLYRVRQNKILKKPGNVAEIIAHFQDNKIVDNFGTNKQLNDQSNGK